MANVMEAITFIKVKELLGSPETDLLCASWDRTNHGEEVLSFVLHNWNKPTGKHRSAKPRLKILLSVCY